MNISLLATTLFSLFVLTAHGADGPPPWAYPTNPPDFKPAPDDGVLRRVPGSSVTYSITQLRNRFIAPVWHPGEHPPLPAVVAQGIVR